MPRNYQPSKVSKAIFQRSNGKYSAPSIGHRCPKSPTGSHWWRIGSPEGSLAVGICRYCGECRQFATTMEAALSARGKR